jgi:hypothetical protein
MLEIVNTSAGHKGQESKVSGDRIGEGCLSHKPQYASDD